MAKPPQVDDATAVARSLKGDPVAFGTLVARYQALAISVAFSICRDRALAEDVAQDGFVLAFRKLTQLADPERFCPWLMHIVKNAALRASQSAARRREVHQAATEDKGPHTENPTAALEFAELVSNVDDESQQILTFKYLHGMTCAEIADRLDVPIGTVTSKISRALSSLREAVRREREQ